MLPITYRSSEGPTSEIKVFQDPAPDFSAAKARGETVLILRNVPVGFAVRTLHSLLMTSSTEGVRWLGDLLFFHKLFDPYEESFLPQMLGIAVASPNDPLFEAIPAVIWVPGVQEPILVNVSSHSCAVCTSNHRTRDHSSFAAVRRNRIANPYLITMWQLQNCRSLHAPLPFTARIIGQHPAVASFKAEPGTFFIGTDLEFRLLAIYAPNNYLDRRAWWTNTVAHYLEQPSASSGTILTGHFNAVVLPLDRNRDLKPVERTETALLEDMLKKHSLIDCYRHKFPTKAMFSFSSHQKVLPSGSAPPSSQPSLPRQNACSPVSAPSSSRLDRTYVSQELRPGFTIEEWDHWKKGLCRQLQWYSKEGKTRVRKTMSFLSDEACRLQLHLLKNPSDQQGATRLSLLTSSLESYELSRASKIALKAKLKVEGSREMGVSSLLIGLQGRIKDSLIPHLKLPSGEIVSDLQGMSKHCTEYFSTLYNGLSPVSRDLSFWNSVRTSVLPSSCSARLDLPFSLAEIESALGRLSKGQVPKSMEAGRTVLIPKRGSTQLVSNLRPITLMNVDYKVLALVLASRLQAVLPKIINPAQAAFIKGRRIGDTINDTLDLMEWAIAQGDPLLVLTVDIRKAYDMGCPLAPLLFVCVIEVMQRFNSYKGCR
ncbi:unnamed protein product [Closterium sp. NIES-65]|nr:unnamed protein product [Closterium sp. NIES-65]